MGKLGWFMPDINRNIPTTWRWALRGHAEQKFNSNNNNNTGTSDIHQSSVRSENKKMAFIIGQVEKLDNSNNHKPVQGQWAQKTQSRSHKGTFTDTPLQVNWSNLKKNMEKGRDLASRGRFWMDESSGQLKMQRLTECVQVHEAENSRQKEQHREMGNVQMIWSLSVDSVQFLS